MEAYIQAYIQPPLLRFHMLSIYVEIIFPPTYLLDNANYIQSQNIIIIIFNELRRNLPSEFIGYSSSILFFDPRNRTIISKSVNIFSHVVQRVGKINCKNLYRTTRR